MNYTIIGYKDNGEDTCRGCVMSRWDSALDIRTSRGPREATKHIAEFLYRNLTKDRYSDGSWEVTVMFNGIPQDELWDRNNTIMTHNPYHRMYRRAEKLAKGRHEQEVADKAAKEAAEKVAREEVERRKQEQKELETYNRLRAKFETKE